MNQTAVIVIVVAAVVIVAIAAAFLYERRRHTRHLRDRFGPEYDRVVQKDRAGERVLEFREKARASLILRPLARAERASYETQWNAIQKQFVDDPRGAVLRADQVVSEVMETIGYPVASFEQRAELISVDHPVVVQNYRAGHEVAVRQRMGSASTEDLRKAMLHYRSLFEELLAESYTERKQARG